ncbi:MAG: copper chaperone Copz family protein [Acidobacteria bacterium]|nr:copper chaperone Copz family protein [Acidobacteriota bacterium]
MPAPVTSRCPQSGTKGLTVNLLTVKALLCESALRVVQEGPYRFCADPTCAVVYFDNEGHVFHTADLRVPVWQKQSAGARMICYCFGENEASMARELAAARRCDASLRVREHIAAGRCACEVRNPRGACCLGDVMEAVARIEAESASVLPK